jgi:hypothetical protein
LKKGEFLNKTRILFVSIGILLFGACATSYLQKTSKARFNFFHGEFNESANLLEKEAHTQSDEQVLFLLERATALFHARRFIDAISDFTKADKLSEISDYTSLSAEAASLLVSDELKHYRVEEYEYVQISQYLALSYLFLGKLEDALVECRRVNHKLYRFKMEAKRNAVQSAMAYYLSAFIYEATEGFDDAFIDYVEAYKLNPKISFLKEDIIRMALKSKRYEDLEYWKKEFNLTKEELNKIKQELNFPELLIIHENGRAPKRVPNPNFPAIPQFEPSVLSQSELKGTITSDEENNQNFMIELNPSELAYSIEGAAMQTYEDKYAPILAKKIAGLGVKYVVAKQIENNTNSLLGALAFWGLVASDQADTRSWLTLPKEFRIARVKLNPKIQNYKLNLSGSFSIQEKKFKVHPQGKFVISVRSL